MALLLHIMQQSEPTMLNFAINAIREEVVLSSREALEETARSVLQAALADAGDNMRGYLFADIIYGIRNLTPTTRDADANGKLLTFSRMLVHVTQDAYTQTLEQRRRVVTPAAPQTHQPTHQNDRMMTLLCFIGRLYVRRLLARRVVDEVFRDLVAPDRRPPESYVLCLCAMLRVVGQTFDECRQGEAILTSVMARLGSLVALRCATDADHPVYSKIVVDAVTGMGGARLRNWSISNDAGVIVLQCHAVSEQEASKRWWELKDQRQLPAREMQLDAPPSSATGATSLLVTACSGRVVAVLFSVSSESLRHAVSVATSLHVHRLRVLGPGGEIF